MTAIFQFQSHDDEILTGALEYLGYVVGVEFHDQLHAAVKDVLSRQYGFEALERVTGQVVEDVMLQLHDAVVDALADEVAAGREAGFDLSRHLQPGLNRVGNMRDTAASIAAGMAQ